MFYLNAFPTLEESGVFQSLQKYTWNILLKTIVPGKMCCKPSVDTMLVWTVRTEDQITNYSGSDYRGERA